MRFAAVPAVLCFAVVGALGVASCSLSSGSGQISGSLNVPDCWVGPYDLNPNFFAALPYMSTLELRIQKGGDYETFSDGVEILIDDTTQIIPNEYGEELSVSLPAGVTPVGVPLAANPNPSIVHLSLYLQATCQIQDVALYALDSVTLNPAGNCDVNDGGEPIVICPGSASGLLAADGGTETALEAGAADSSASPSDAGGVDGGTDSGVAPASPQPIGHSSIHFSSLFDGNENAVSSSERLNQGSLDTIYLADPREMCPGGVGPPPPCRGYLHGNFSFYFQRGRPAQPFP